MNLAEILAKDPADLSDAERAFLEANKAQLSEADAEKFGIVKDEEEKGIDMAAVKALLGEAATEAGQKAADRISETLVEKFMAGVQTARKTAIDAGRADRTVVAKGDITRRWLKAVLAGDKVAAKAVTTSESGAAPDDAQAGLLIPVELANEVLRIAEAQFGIARRDMRYLPFSGPGNTRTIPALGTSVSVFWTEEMGVKKSTQPKFTIVTQTLKKLAAIVPFTEEILEDSQIDLLQLVATLFAEALAKEEDIQFFAGTGSPWTGILNNGNVNIVNGAGDVSQTTADDLLAMIDATPAGAKKGAKFYWHPTVTSVFRKIKDQNGQYILQNPVGSNLGTIWNYPYEESEAFPAVADVGTGDPFILFSNLKLAAIFGDKRGMQVKLLDQATINDTDDSTELNLATQDMVAMRIVERVGYVLALPKAATVLKASATDS